jgi:C4-dicarboxylate-binding protein DctP
VRTILTFFLVFVLVFTVGCGNQSTAGSGGSGKAKSDDSGTKSSESTGDKKIVIRLGHSSAPGSARDLGAQKVKEIVEAETGGKVEVQIFPASQLGGPREQIESVQLGNQEMVIQPTSWLGGFQPLITLLDIPFLLPTDKDSLLKVHHSDGMKQLLNTTSEIGIETLAIWHTGYKQFTGPVALNTPEAFKGVKFRAMPSPVIIEQFESLDAIPADIPWPETYNALQNGAIDAQENPIDTIYDMKFHEVQQVLTISNHGVLDQLIMANKAWFDGLPDDIKQAVIKGVQEGEKVATAKTYELIEKYIVDIEASGVEVVEVSGDQRQALIDKTKVVKQFYVDKFGDKGKALLEAIEKEVKAASK